MCNSKAPDPVVPAAAPPPAQQVTRILPGDAGVDKAQDTQTGRAKKARSALTIPKASVAGSSGLNIPL